MSTEGILGGMWAYCEGYVDTTGTVHACAGAAEKFGAEIVENDRVLALNQTVNAWEVVTEIGAIQTEHIETATGLWPKQVGRMTGVELPASPLNYHYLIPAAVEALDREGFSYMRQDQKGNLFGIYKVEQPPLKRSNAFDIVAAGCCRPRPSCSDVVGSGLE